MPSISISRPSLKDLEHCLAIRRKVFIEGQKVPEALEVDGLDDVAQHYLLRLDGVPVGTARVRYIEDKAKVERVAILSSQQGRGLGKKLMQYIIADIERNKKARKIVLGAQVSAIPFYENLGFSICSDEYMDANIAHKDMQLDIASQKI